MSWLKLYGTNLPKNSDITSEKARNHGFHLQWEVKQEMRQDCHVEKPLFGITELIKKLKLVILLNKI